MPGYPNTGSDKSCCIPSTTPPPASTTYCGCSTASTATIPQKVQIDLARVFAPFHSECSYCTDLNGSYILRPATEYWGTSYCTYVLRFTKGFTKNPSIPSTLQMWAIEGCTRVTNFMWMARLEIAEGTANPARWNVNLICGTYPYDIKWTWTFLTRNQSPVPTPWSYPCLDTTDSTYFSTPWPGSYGSAYWPCHAAWDSTSWNSTVYNPTTGYAERDWNFMVITATDFYGNSTKFPHITITPSSST